MSDAKTKLPSVLPPVREPDYRHGYTNRREPDGTWSVVNGETVCERGLTEQQSEAAARALQAGEQEKTKMGKVRKVPTFYRKRKQSQMKPVKGRAK